MSFWQNLDDDAKKAVQFLAVAQQATAKINLASSLKAIVETFENPKQALTDGAVQTDLYTAADVLGALSLIHEPASTALASASVALRGAGALEPEVAGAAEFLLGSGLLNWKPISEEQYREQILSGGFAARIEDNR
jgi:hypothetical protein